MANRKIKDSAVTRVGKYLEGRIAGSNKKDSALMAGYSAQTARTPSLIEQTKAYSVVVTEMLDRNTRIMRAMIDSIEQSVQSGQFDLLHPKIKAEIAYKMAQIHDVMTPKVTVKETQNKDGTISRVLWGTNGAPQAVTPE